MKLSKSYKKAEIDAERKPASEAVVRLSLCLSFGLWLDFVLAFAVSTCDQRLDMFLACM